MCADCQAVHGYGSGPYPGHEPPGTAAGLDLLPTWALEQKAAANRQVIAVTHQRLAAGEEVARMYQEPGLPGWSGKPRWPKRWWLMEANSGEPPRIMTARVGRLELPHGLRLSSRALAAMMAESGL